LGRVVTHTFRRFQRKEQIRDAQLAHAIADAERGLIDADLGGGLIKQRVARPGQGKRSGFRTLIAYQAGDRAVFLFGFAKRERDNISDAQLADLKALASDMLSRSDDVIDEAIASGSIQEVEYDEHT